jgi:hypothetical protein
VPRQSLRQPLFLNLERSHAASRTVDEISAVSPSIEATEQSNIAVYSFAPAVSIVCDKVEA